MRLEHATAYRIQTGPPLSLVPPVAPSLSLALAPFSGLFLVILLGLVGLLLDLAVNRGSVTNGHAIQNWVESQGNTPEAMAAAKTAQGSQGVGILSVAIRIHSKILGSLFTHLANIFPGLCNNYVYLLVLVAGILIAAVLFSGIVFLQKRMPPPPLLMPSHVFAAACIPKLTDWVH